MNVRFFLMSLLAMIFSEQAFAYIDPGVVGSLYQVIYLIIFGVVTGFVLTPFKYIKALFSRFLRREK